MEDGRPRFVAGNAAVSFRVRHCGQDKILKCYTRTNRHLAEIYGDDYHPRELCVVDIAGRKSWVDCLLTPYIEGITLDEALCRAQSHEELFDLAASFDALACQILFSGRAHGDLKPENIVCTPEGRMVAIDWDAAFLPTFAGEQAPETGTAAYQHPRRGADLYDGHIDDYSIAFISVMLYSAAIDTLTLEHFRQHREPLLSPRDILSGRTNELERISDCLAQRGMAREYRLAQLLRERSPRLFSLKDTLRPPLPAADSNEVEENSSETPTLDQVNGYWGCRTSKKWAIGPYFDNGYEPTCGIMLAELGGYQHLVDLSGRVVKTLPKGTRIKPLHNGHTTAFYTDGREEVICAEDLLQNFDK